MAPRSPSELVPPHLDQRYAPVTLYNIFDNLSAAVEIRRNVLLAEM